MCEKIDIKLFLIRNSLSLPPIVCHQSAGWATIIKLGTLSYLLTLAVKLRAVYFLSHIDLRRMTALPTITLTLNAIAATISLCLRLLSNGQSNNLTKYNP